MLNPLGDDLNKNALTDALKKLEEGKPLEKIAPPQYVILD
jgi:hypothetical protein